MNQIDLHNDPPPDLVIEVDVSRSSLDKLPIYAALGVPEVWRCRSGSVYVYRLVGSNYVEVDQSHVLPGLTSTQLTSFAQEGLWESRQTWRRRIQGWARETGTA